MRSSLSSWWTARFYILTRLERNPTNDELEPVSREPGGFETALESDIQQSHADPCFGGFRSRPRPFGFELDLLNGVQQRRYVASDARVTRFGSDLVQHSLELEPAEELAIESLLDNRGFGG